MDYKLLVLDVDGTLLTSDHQLTARTRQTLVKAQQAGITLVLSSGRPPHGLLPVARELDLPTYGGYIIAYNGSQIINARTGKVMFERRVNPEVLPYLEKKARKNRLVTDTPDNPHIQAEARLNGLQIVHEPEFSIAVDFQPGKVVLVSDDEPALITLTELWKRRLNGTLEAHRSEDYFLEILPYGVDKSAALSVLLDHLKIDPSHVAAFGDGVRDVGVLQMAALGVAMANARQSVKACADSVTASSPTPPTTRTSRPKPGSTDCR